VNGQTQKYAFGIRTAVLLLPDLLAQRVNDVIPPPMSKISAIHFRTAHVTKIP